MTFGEMYAWTNRLNGIIEVGGPLKTTRLCSLIDDLESATDLDNDKFALKLYMVAQEELIGHGMGDSEQR